MRELEPRLADVRTYLMPSFYEDSQSKAGPVRRILHAELACALLGSLLPGVILSTSYSGSLL